VRLLALVVLDAGPLQVEVHTSPSAQLFYVVDQLSGWSLYSHPQYRRRLGPFSPAEEQLLKRHVALRQVHGWGDLEPIFYGDRDWGPAIDEAVRHGTLSQAEGETERAVLSHFAPRVNGFLKAGGPAVEAAIAGLRGRAAELEAFARKAARFTERRTLRLPLFLVPSGEAGSSGGGANGGVLVVEVGEGTDPFYTLLHEAWHAFVESQAALVDAAVRTTPGLDRTLLGEGMAYVIHPGLYHSGTDDPLAQRVRDDWMDTRKSADERARRYAMFNRFALALRPLLSAALDDPDATLAQFLPRACDVFRGVQSLSGALDAPGRRGLFLFGPKVPSLWDRAVGLRLNVWSRGHDGSGYEVLAKARPGDVILLLFTRAELSEGLPAAWRDLLPASLSEVKAAVDEGHVFEAEARRRQWRVILLAATDPAQLAQAAASSKRVGSVFSGPAAREAGSGAP
jgi:hypothetical protein